MLVLSLHSRQIQTLTHSTVHTHTHTTTTTTDEPLLENLNARALEVINRIHAKLTGRDFSTSEESDDLSVEQQVDRLIVEATSVENLCQLYQGWCALW